MKAFNALRRRLRRPSNASATRKASQAGAHDELLAVGGVYAGLYASWLDATSAGDALAVPLG